jgi:hypothetical protein
MAGTGPRRVAQARRLWRAGLRSQFPITGKLTGNFENFALFDRKSAIAGAENDSISIVCGKIRKLSPRFVKLTIAANSAA